MIRSIDFPAKESAAFRDQLNNAGEGFFIRIIPRSTADGLGVKFLLAVRTPDREATFVNVSGESSVECDEDPTNSSHVCPGPLCP